ncbi:MAG: S8 family serine peptidase, partial [Gammaproteobacteria bacterium]|nr:S8 family serine peptidase [Gammaproteobacteria bacterium]
TQERKQISSTPIPPVAASEHDGLIVVFKSKIPPEAKKQLLKSYGLVERKSNTDIILPTLSNVIIAANTPAEQVLSELSTDPQVDFADYNYFVYSSHIPDDPEFPLQWALNNTGQTGGRVDSDIDAIEAWDYQAETNPVVVAVLDTGVDYNHPDLKDAIWSNPDEIANNGIDDDGNGYIDDVRGWNFVDGTNNPMDNNNHGTHVAGVIAAIGDNQLGMVGVAGLKRNVKIMPLKFMSASGAGTILNAIEALQYAVAKKVKISNNSWGGRSNSLALSAAIEAASAQSHLFIASAGNDGLNNDNNLHFPSGFDLNNIIAVTASSDKDVLASNANYGVKNVDLAAPGTEIYSTIRNNAYARLSGSSMATPHVTGVAAILLGHNPGLSYLDLRMIILSNVDRMPSYNGVVASGGRLNAHHAIMSLVTGKPGTEPEPPPGTNITITPAEAQTIPVGGTIQFNARGKAAGETYRWIVSNAYAQIDEVTGLFRGNYPGVVDVYLRDASQAVAGPVTVSVGPMVITPSTLADLGFGEQQVFTTSGGVPPLSWSIIANPGVVSFSATDNINNILVTAGITSGSFSLNLTDALGNTAPQVGPFNVLMKPFELSPLTLSMVTGESKSLFVSGGRPPYVWSSSDASVVSVNQGTISAHKAGVVNVSATENNGTGDLLTSVITVEYLPLEVSPTSSTIVFDDTEQLTAKGGTPPYSWMSEDTSVATVDDNGLVSPVFIGTSNINVTDSAPSPETAVSTITVSTAPLSVVNGNAAIWMGFGNTVQLEANGGIGPYTWSSITPGIVTVDANGLVTAQNIGSGFIALSDEIVNRGLGNPVQTNIEVRQIFIQPISIAKPVGETFIMSGQGYGQLTWSVSDTQLASINAQSGVINTLRAGEVSVYLRDELGNTAQTLVTISDLPVSINPLSGSQQNLFVGDEISVTGSGNTLWGGLTWSTSDESVLSVLSSFDNSAAIKAIAAGQAQVVLTDSAGNTTQSETIIVNSVEITSFIPASLEKAQSLVVNAVGKGNLSWSVNNSNIASISTNNTAGTSATLQAIQTGIVTVSVRDQNLNEITSSSITITPIPVVINSLPGTALSIGETMVLSGSGDGVLTWTVQNNLGRFEPAMGTSVNFIAES